MELTDENVATGNTLVSSTSSPSSSSLEKESTKSNFQSFQQENKLGSKSPSMSVDANVDEKTAAGELSRGVVEPSCTFEIITQNDISLGVRIDVNADREITFDVKHMPPKFDRNDADVESCKHFGHI